MSSRVVRPRIRICATRATRACLATALVFGLGAASACSNSATDPEATYSPSPFDKGSTISVVLASGSDLAKPIEAALTAAEFTPDVRVGASGADQHDKITAILTSPPKVLVVDAMDADAIRDDLNTAQEAGAVVIALSSLPKDTKAFDFYVGADPRATGKLQGQALVDGVRGRVEKAASKVELFAGPPTDAAAQMRFDAAWDVIGPAVDAKTVEVGSGEKSFAQAAAATTKLAATRMTTLLSSYYQQSAPQGFLAPDDATALALMEQIRATKVPSTPFDTGAGSTAAGVKALMSGQLGVTTYVDPVALADAVATMVKELSEGKEPTLNHKDDVNNGAEAVPAHLLTPTIVRRGDAATVFAKNATLKALVTP